MEIIRSFYNLNRVRSLSVKRSPTARAFIKYCFRFADVTGEMLDLPCVIIFLCTFM